MLHGFAEVVNTRQRLFQDRQVGRTVGIGDAGAQRRCLEIIAVALEKAGASLRQVVRTRTLLVRIEDWAAVAAVHGEFFGEILSREHDYAGVAIY